MMKYTVVLPTLNEEENIGTMIRSLMSLPEPPAEIRVVDDHSFDGTQQVVTGLEKEYPGVVHFMLNAGRKSLSASVVTGFDAASTEILLCMDADGQHRVQDVPLLVKAIAEGSSIAIGSRYVENGGFAQKWNFFRVLMSRSAAFMAFASLHVKVKDPMSGFFAVRDTAYRSIRKGLAPDGFKIMLEILYLLQLTGDTRVKECGIIFELRQKGESKLTAKTIRQYLAMLVSCMVRRGKLKRLLAE